MNQTIEIDNQLCKKCKTCVEVCPNVIYNFNENRIETRPERCHLCVTCGQCMAVCPEKAIKVEGLSYDDDFFELTNGIDLEIPFQKLIESRRSVRSFKDKPIPKEILEKIVDAISFAPPGFPPLKTELVVINDKELIRKAFPLMVSLYDKLLKGISSPIGRWIIKGKIGKEKFKTIDGHIKPMFDIKLPFMKEGLEDAITRNAPAMILFHANKNTDNYQTDIYIALTYGILKAHSLGLGATAIDLIPPAIDRVPELRKLFQIPEENQVVASIILGYPKYQYKRGIRRNLKSVQWL